MNRFFEYLNVYKRISRLEKNYEKLESKISAIEKALALLDFPHIVIKSKIMTYLSESEAQEVINMGVHTFEDLDRFSSWLQVPCIALGNKIPLDLLKSKEGKDMVMTLLGRIEHGILS